MKDKVKLVPVLFLIFTTLWLRLANLGYSDFQGDESNALRQSKPGLTALAYIFSRTKGPVEYLITRLIHVIDPAFHNRFFVRLPFALAGILAIFFFYKLVQIHYGNKIALYATLFLSTNGLFVGLFRIVQYQPFSILFSILTLYCFSLALQRDRWRYYGIYLGVFFWTAALFTHYDGVFIAPFAVYLLVRWYIQNHGIPSPTRLMKYLIFPFLASAILLLGYYIPFFYNPTGRVEGYLLSRVAGMGDTSLIPSSMRNFTLYNPILAIYVYPTLGVLAMTRAKKALVPLAWFAFSWGILELIVYEPGTHIYNYVIPATILAALGVEAVEQMIKRGLGQNRGIAFNAIWIATMFLSLAAISHLIFVDHTPEYPFEKRRILFWTIGGIEEGYRLRIYGFPYFRRWEEIGEYVTSQMRSGYYVTNEGEFLARFYIPYKFDLIKAEYFIYIYYPQTIHLTQELRELEGKFAEEQQQLRQERGQLETISCTVVLFLSLVLLTLWSLVEVVFSFVAEISGVSYDKPTFSIISAVIFLVVFFLILIMNPLRWLNRDRLEQVSVTLHAKEEEYIQAKGRIEDNLAKKQGELLHHQKTAGNL